MLIQYTALLVATHVGGRFIFYTLYIGLVQEKTPLLPCAITLDTSLEKQAIILSSTILGGLGEQDLVKAHNKVGLVPKSIPQNSSKTNSF